MLLPFLLLKYAVLVPLLNGPLVTQPLSDATSVDSLREYLQQFPRSKFSDRELWFITGKMPNGEATQQAFRDIARIEESTPLEAMLSLR
jgi:hypothetical protein